MFIFRNIVLCIYIFLVNIHLIFFFYDNDLIIIISSSSSSIITLTIIFLWKFLQVKPNFLMGCCEDLWSLFFFLKRCS